MVVLVVLLLPLLLLLMLMLSAVVVAVVARNDRVDFLSVCRGLFMAWLPVPVW